MNEGKGLVEKTEPKEQPQPPTASAVSEPVKDLLNRYGKVNLGLVAEMHECWNRLADCLGAQPDTAILNPTDAESVSLEGYMVRRAEIGQRRIEALLIRLRREQLPSRFLAALRDHSERTLGLCSTASSLDARTEAAATAFPAANGQKRPLRLHAELTSEISHSRKRRRRFAEAVLAQAFGAVNDAVAAFGLSLTLFDLRIQSGSLESEGSRTPGSPVDFLQKRGNSVARTLQAWESWEQKQLERLTQSTERRRHSRDSPANAAEADLLIHWTEQSRLLESSNQFALALVSTGQSLLEHARSAFGEVATDNADLASQYEAVNRSLKSFAAGDTELFSGELRYVPASRRFLEARRRIERELAGLPERIEKFARPVPVGQKLRRRVVFPRKIAVRSARRLLEPELTLIGEEISQNQLRVVQEIERAREVVSFGQELGGNQAGGSELAREATANAIALLDDFGRQIPQILQRPSLESRLVSAIAFGFAESRVIASSDQLRFLRHIARHELRRAVTLALGTFSPVARDSWLRFEEYLRSGVRRFEVALGLLPVAPEAKVDVRVRPFLPAEFTIDLSSRQIPPLYRHLFRLEPVQDARFLVGRERELQAIADARSLWESRRPAAVLIVGQRGSGKTSLINCALREALGGLPVVRGELSRRLLREAELEEFIANLFGCSPSRITEPAQRVVILEETERCYLKQVGGYGAIRALQRIISSTCTSMFWLVSINEMAFRFISSATGFGDVFTHRINAGTATLAELKEALLLRHRLSGLRLHFIPATADTGKEQEGDEAERLFFDTLFRQSTGVFRTAFDIWLGQIDRIEAGVMTMKPIISSDLAPVVEHLPLALVFTLLAILQHGALTVDQHMAVFQLPVSASRAQLEELLAREIIEQDPGREGFRVRPEAMPLIKEALYRRNLLGL